MYGTILAFIQLWHLAFISFILLHYTWRIFEPLCVYEPSFNTDKYGNSKSISITDLMLLQKKALGT